MADFILESLRGGLDRNMMVASGRPIAEIAAEISKCELVCANCHRIRTAERHTLRKEKTAHHG